MFIVIWFALLSEIKYNSSVAFIIVSVVGIEDRLNFNIGFRSFPPVVVTLPAFSVVDVP